MELHYQLYTETQKPSSETILPPACFINVLTWEINQQIEKSLCSRGMASRLHHRANPVTHLANHMGTHHPQHRPPRCSAHIHPPQCKELVAQYECWGCQTCLFMCHMCHEQNSSYPPCQQASANQSLHAMVTNLHRLLHQPAQLSGIHNHPHHYWPIL